MNTGVLRPALPAPPPWLPVAIPLVAALLLYRETALGMVAIWARSDTFMHGFLVPPIVAWLIWRRREVLAAHAARPAGWVLLPMAGVAAVWLLGELAAVNAAAQAALVALLVLAVPAVLGLGAARLLLFPLGFLFFAVPVGEFLMPLLMERTADFTVTALRLSGIPVYREGLQFVIPSGSWSVVEACSGIRYLIASLTTGVLFAYLHYRSLSRRLVFVAVSIAVPVLANWLRAYLIVLLGHLSGNELAAGADHLIYGWLFFGIVIGLMFMIGARWSEPQPHEPSPAAAPAAATATVAATAATDGPRTPGPAWAVALAAVGLLLLPHALLRGLERTERGGAAPQLAGLEVPAGSWRPAAMPADWKPAFLNPAAEFERGHAREGDGARVGLYVGYYRRQDRDSKLVGSGNRLHGGSGEERWTQIAAGHRMPSGGVPGVRTALLRGAAQPGQGIEPRLVVWQLYWVNGTLTASDVRAKLAGAWHRLLGRGDDAAVIVVSALRQDDGGEEALLEAFLREQLPRLQAQLQQVREAAGRAPASGVATL